MRQIMTGPESLTAIYMPGTTIAAMSFAMLVSILVPIAAFIFFKKKNPNAKKISVLVGALTFIIAALVLEKLLHAAVFKAFGTALNSNIWLYALYGGLAAAVFEETKQNEEKLRDKAKRLAKTVLGTDPYTKF